MVSALSHEFRNLDGVSVTDTQPALKIYLDDVPNIQLGVIRGASVTITTPDGRLIAHFVQTSLTLHQLAQEITIIVDGGLIEKMRRAAHPSSSP